MYWAFPMNFYEEIPSSQIAAEKKYFLSAIYKLLPYKECSYEYLDNYFGSVLQQLKGFNKLTGFQPEVLTIISNLEMARKEPTQFRKCILDAANLVDTLRGGESNV